MKATQKLKMMNYKKLIATLKLINMNSIKILAVFIGLLFFGKVSLGQNGGERLLYIIDSIPLINDAEDWNPILNEDIADVTVVKNKDILKQMGWGQLDGITYVFTKAYRLRPDSLKSIPGLKQMHFKNEAWYFKNEPYTGSYIDYYNSGRILNKGTLTGGKLNGAVTNYFKSGEIKEVTDFKDGKLNGFRK